jgi:rubrerythrin
VKTLPEHATRFLREAGPVPWNEAACARARVDPQVSRILHVVAQLEADTAITTQHAHTLGIDRGADIAAFLRQWAAEEAEHSRAISLLLQHQTYDPPVPAPPAIERHRRLVARIPRQALGRMRTTGLVYCTLGAAAEYVTVVIYRELVTMIADPAVAALLRAITSQERRHCAFFLTAARERARALSPVEARLTRWVLAEMWAPPGVPSLGLDTWRDAFAPFVEDAALRTRVEEMDRVVDTIPHLAGLHLMQQFLEQCVPLTE